MIKRLMKGGAVLAASQGAIFLLQTLLLQRGDHQGVADLAAYIGTISLCFYLLDGNSGIAFLQGLRSHDEGELREAFFVYRATVLGLGTAIVLWICLAAQFEIRALACATLLGGLMRSYGLDGDLDRRGLAHLATAFANAWLIIIGTIGLIYGQVTPYTAAVGVVLGSSLSLVGRYTTRSQGVRRTKMTSARPLVHILSFLGTYGIGQVYGRLSLALLGAWFSGGVAAFAIYSKQTMNAVGILNALIRRVELSRDAHLGRTLTLTDFKWSLGLQALAAIIIGTGLLVAAAFTGIAGPAAAAIVVWQVLEKTSSNQAFLLQIMGRTRQAYVMLVLVCVAGVAGLYVGGFWLKSVLVYTTVETIAFLLCAVAWIAAYRRNRAAHAPTNES